MSQTKPHPWRHAPPPSQCLGECFRRVCHVEKAWIRENHTRNWGAKIRGEGGVIAVWYISSMGGKKCAQFRMKVVSDVLLLLCLHDFDLQVTVKAGQALACLYSEARLYKGPGQSTLPQLAAARSTGNISVRTQKVNHSNTRVLFPLRNHCCT